MTRAKQKYWAEKQKKIDNFVLTGLNLIPSGFIPMEFEIVKSKRFVFKSCKEFRG